jgi:hypothetical protein
LRRAESMESVGSGDGKLNKARKSMNQGLRRTSSFGNMLDNVVSACLFMKAVNNGTVK